jgi:signal transduction histidine kinase
MRERESWHRRGQGLLSAGTQPVMEREIEISRRPVMLNDGVRRADGARADFHKSMTHELRTPLNVIIGLCQLLERDRKHPLSPTQTDAVNRMERNARSLLESVNRLLESVRNGNFK